MNIKQQAAFHEHAYQLALKEADHIGDEVMVADGEDINDWSPAELILYLITHGYLDQYFGVEE